MVVGWRAWMDGILKPVTAKVNAMRRAGTMSRIDKLPAVVTSFAYREEYFSELGGMLATVQKLHPACHFSTRQHRKRLAQNCIYEGLVDGPGMASAKHIRLIRYQTNHLARCRRQVERSIGYRTRSGGGDHCQSMVDRSWHSRARAPHL